MFGGAPGPAPAPADNAAKALLERKLPEVKFDGVPFADVVDFLRQITSTNIFVDWRSLEAAGIDRNAPIAMQLRDVPYEDVLSLLVRNLGGGATYTVKKGVTVIEAGGEAPAARLTTKAYDVADLLAAAQLPANQGLGTTPMVDLTQTIMGTVAPQSWRNPQSGIEGSGTLGAYGTKIVVTATDEVHRDVAALLDMLRDKPATGRAAARGASPATVPAAEFSVEISE